MSRPQSRPSVNKQLESLNLQESSWWDDRVYYRRRNYPLKDIPAPPAIIGHETDLIKDQNCFALNFGYKYELSMPSLSLSIDSKLPIDTEGIRTTFPSCLIVMIGGKQLTRINDIVRKVESVTDQINFKTLAYFAEKVGDVIPDESTTAIVSSR